MKISNTHQCFANRTSQEALTNPEKFLGPNYKTVLNFWIYIETLNRDQWKKCHENYENIPKNNNQYLNGSQYIFRAADYTIGSSNRFSAYFSTISGLNRESIYIPSGYYNTFNPLAAVGFATLELIGMHLLLQSKTSLFFVPLFGNVAVY